MRKPGKFYEYYGSDTCEKEWNFRQFRTIIVQRNEERMTHLLEALNKQYNHRTFWLTHEAAYKADIGSEIFKTSRDFANSSYSFVQ